MDKDFIFGKSIKFDAGVKVFDLESLENIIFTMYKVVNVMKTCGDGVLGRGDMELEFNGLVFNYYNELKEEFEVDEKGKIFLVEGEQFSYFSLQDSESENDVLSYTLYLMFYERGVIGSYKEEVYKKNGDRVEYNSVGEGGLNWFEKELIKKRRDWVLGEVGGLIR